MSNRVKKLLKNRALMTVLVIVMVWVSLTFMFSPRTRAYIVAYYYTYYSDSTYQNEVGRGWLDCHGVTHHFGAYSSYMQVEEYIVCD
jgi:hypothetical protein